MISQNLDRKFVLAESQRVIAALRETEEPKLRGLRTAPVKPAPDKPANADEAADALEAALKKDILENSGAKCATAAGKKFADENGFISHDPVLSLLQTAIDAYFKHEAPHKLISATGTPSTRGMSGRVLGAEQHIAHEGAPLSTRSFQLGDPMKPQGTFEQFSTTDPRWVSVEFAKLYRLFRGKIAFPKEPPPPLNISNRARLILVADWGSGIPRAVQVGQQMRAVLDQGIAAGLEQHVIHLGDVYYSGYKDEYNDRLLKHWPVALAEKDAISSWSLNGNHDMYSGGHAYFEVLLSEPRFAPWHRGRSFFQLSNDFWDVFGLDTAYEDETLCEPQPSWLTQARRPAPTRTLLLSHHQLFSAYEKGCPKIGSSLAATIAKQKIDAWFWGHEHRCVAYAKGVQGVENARLIGHGGVPVFQEHGDDPLKAPAVYEFREYIADGADRWAKFGFAVLDFANDQINVRYISENGTTHRSETI